MLEFDHDTMIIRVAQTVLYEPDPELSETANRKVFRTIKHYYGLGRSHKAAELMRVLTSA